MSASTLFFALVGGILPALLWLWFWLREDRLHPEPRALIIRTFIMGMVAVPFVLPIEQVIQQSFFPELHNLIFPSAPESFITFASSLAVFLNPQLWVLFLWAAAEEIFKFGAAYLAAFRSKEYDEPIDAVVYMLTAALGFAALENTLFLISSLAKTSAFASFLTGNLRFIGATLLHVLSSGIIGFFMGTAFWKGRFGKEVSLVFGISLAILLHAIFNAYIMKSAGSEIFAVFSFVWVAIILLIAGFEKVKHMTGWERL